MNISGSHNLSGEFEMPENDVGRTIWLLEVGTFQLEPELKCNIFTLFKCINICTITVIYLPCLNMSIYVINQYIQ